MDQAACQNSFFAHSLLAKIVNSLDIFRARSWEGMRWLFLWSPPPYPYQHFFSSQKLSDISFSSINVKSQAMDFTTGSTFLAFSVPRKSRLNWKYWQETTLTTQERTGCSRDSIRLWWASQTVCDELDGFGRSRQLHEAWCTGASSNTNTQHRIMTKKWGSCNIVKQATQELTCTGNTLASTHRAPPNNKNTSTSEPLSHWGRQSLSMKLRLSECITKCKKLNAWIHIYLWLPAVQGINGSKSWLTRPGFGWQAVSPQAVSQKLPANTIS